MLGDKERFYIPLANKFQRIELVHMLQILGTGISKLFLETKKLNLGSWGGTKEGLSYYILQIQLFNSPYLFHLSTLW